MIENENEIDAVITWVDGNDPEHQKKREIAEAAGSKNQSELITGRDRTRFIDNGELEYCIYSIRKFAPWIRRIFLVTDNQHPEFLTPRLMEFFDVTLVDHREIFRSCDWALPTFNTRTIETVLWRIEGLSSKFIYFNDDFVLTRPVSPADFFLDDRVVLRGRWNRVRKYGPFRMKMNNHISEISRKLFGITRSMHLLLQIKSARTAGFREKFYRSPHVPHPVRKKTLSDFFSQNMGLFSKNIKYKFRSTNQISSIFLANHLEIAADSSHLRDAKDAMTINGELEFGFTFRIKMNRIRKKKVKFLCLQAVENLDENQKDQLFRLLRSHLDMPAHKTQINEYQKHLEEI